MEAPDGTRSVARNEYDLRFLTLLGEMVDDGLQAEEQLGVQAENPGGNLVFPSTAGDSVGHLRTRNVARTRHDRELLHGTGSCGSVASRKRHLHGLAPALKGDRIVETWS